jgi:hypothetical protein
VNAITGYRLVGLFWRARAVFGHLADFFTTKARRNTKEILGKGGHGVGVNYARPRVTRLTVYPVIALRSIPAFIFRLLFRSLTIAALLRCLNRSLTLPALIFLAYAAGSGFYLPDCWFLLLPDHFIKHL